MNALDFYGKPLAVAPQGSPAIPILNHILDPDKPRIIFLSHGPRQLAAKLITGEIRAALVPEPLVTVFLEKMPYLTVGENLEQAYGRFTQTNARMPIAGIAVNARTAKRYPELMAFLAQEILAAAQLLSEDPAKGIACLPKAFESFISRDLIEKSLGRDLFMVRKSHGIQEEIQNYLSVLGTPHPDNKDLFYK
ncbi:MAG: hypothetical protein HUK40_03215 [Desulfobacter sp.]|nr:hypothetical protein [Desulfobacter sp.]